VSLGIVDAPFVVGGGSTPFGLAVARELVASGARVLLVGPDLSVLEPAVEELDGGALPCVADLADPADAARVGGVAAALLGGVDGVVLPPFTLPTGDVLELTEREWLAWFSEGVTGPLGLLRGIVPLLEGEGGTVLFPIPDPPGEPDAGHVVRRMLNALVEELTGMLGPGVRVGRVEPIPNHARDAVRLLAPQ
jgi:NAD(P)-dependent dehydrogenase (short-subunit alcohol dehydrogenase family)